MSDQISLFEFLYDPFVPKKVRLYQFFAGIGSQALALKKLGVEFEDYKIAEWAVPSIKAYNSIHTKDFTDYSKGKTREEMVKVVKNVSLDYDKPISEKQLNSKSDEWEDWLIEKEKITLCPLYLHPYNFKRTGCAGCPFNIHLQEQLETMSMFLPAERRRCEIIWKKVYDEYRRIGFRLNNNLTIWD